MLHALPEQTRPIRVAFLTPTLYLGGAERWILSLARHFVAAQAVGIAVRSRRHSPPLLEEAERICPVHFPTKSDKPAKVRRAVERAIDRADVLISWGCADLAELALPAIAAGTPVIEVSHRGPDAAEQSTLLKHSHTGATFLAAVSATAARAFPDHARGDVTVIYNGAEPARCAPRFGRDQVRRKFGLAPDDRVLLYIGRLAASKGPQHLLAALAHLPPAWRIVFVGPDGPGDGGNSSMERQLVTEARRFSSGRVAFSRVADHIGDFLAMADVFGLASDSEAMPLTVLEAWLAGTPTVLTTCDAVEELSRDLTNGRLQPCVVGSQRPDAIAHAVLERDTAGRDDELVAYLRALAWEKFTASAMAARWEAYLGRALGLWADLAISPPLNIAAAEHDVRDASHARREAEEDAELETVGA